MVRSKSTISFAVLFMFSISCGIYFGISTTVNYAIEKDASRRALKWSQHFVATIENLDELIKTGQLTQNQRSQIIAASTIGDVFRFKVFNSQAQLVLISDELGETRDLTGKGDHNGNAAKVLASGKNEIELQDGTQKANRPDLYVEAYVPVISQEGAVLGVVEVYLDQSAVSIMLHRLFTFTAITIASVLTAVFCIPYLAFVAKSDAERKARRRVKFLAHYDQVSNLLNRTGLMESLAKRENEQQANMSKLAVVFLDIDHFKTINDTYGHKAGDAFLKHLGETIADTLGPDDLAGRMGGDEFVIILKRNTLEEVYQQVEAIQYRVSQPLHFDGMTVVGHLSFGIDYSGNAEVSIGERMHRADIALYQAKIDGRNMHCTFSLDMEQKTIRRRAIEAALSSGLENDRFEIHFQPLLLQKNKRCIGFEALLRLKDESGDFISPTEFIPVAEAIGQINRIGTWVLKMAVKALASWPEQYFVSVNLSARQLNDPNLVDQIKTLLLQANVPPSRLELEVTESLLVLNTEFVLEQLNGLRELGISLAMDDFGTGYSSLGYLWQFGFDKLKIDRSFICGLDQNSEKTMEILETIIMLGHRLGMTVTAEGIENEAQAEALAKLHCDQFQGFLYGKPIPQDELPAYMLMQTLEKGMLVESRSTGKGENENPDLKLIREA